MSRAERRGSKREKKRQAGESARKAQQLAELALAREELQGRSAAEWLNLFNEHQGTPEACPGGASRVGLCLGYFRCRLHARGPCLSGLWRWGDGPPGH